MTLEVNVSLSLPRDSLTVPVVRHLCEDALGELGVTDSCRSDILLAMTEACTNVVEHCSAERTYEVDINLDEERCVISIRDPSNTFDVEEAAAKRVSRTTTHDNVAEAGRGLDLMHALVDDVRFVTDAGAHADADADHGPGMVVVLCKDLEFDESHPVRRRLLAERRGSP